MDTVVVGGGLAGLVTAWELTRAGRRVVLVESTDHLGGPLRSHQVAGLTLNSGAESFATATPIVFDLLADLGLSDRVVLPRSGRSWIVNVRGAFPSPAMSYLGIPADPTAPDVVAIIGQEAAQHAARESSLPSMVGYQPGVSLGAYVATRMGRAVRDLLVEPVVGGVHSTHPDLLELDSIAPQLPVLVERHGSLQAAVRAIRSRNDSGRQSAGAAVAGLAPTLSILVDTLAERIRTAGGEILLGIPAERVLPQYTEENPTVPQGWLVRTAAADLTAADVVVATNPHVTRSLLQDVRALAESIPTIPTSVVALATLVVDDERLDGAPRDNGVLLAGHTPGIIAKALTHVSAKWDHVDPGNHRHVLRLSYGRSGKEVPTRVELPDLALNDARRILGIHLERDSIVGFDQVRWSQTMTQARPGHQNALHEVAGRLASYPGLALTGAWMAGTGIAAVTSHARRTAAHVVGQRATHPITAESLHRLTEEPA
ncbi:protoporphyrinogen oxidase [Aestuariimicrobium sp. p3-SID1156]|uniref:protoporphyrinogen oxidase n=1 Tax=Aestuariimicrobium sp. p3-SID1156 TaxID=2916038 RepID=UPI00223B804F|nr:protoporphyrinogen oxidase [Aestuariimicrobium sp. p3-SID1156]MCT1458099.1 protoporphyrinogen oxidase [Aestuariimicrobium sp. p3-SID1156]